jgi:DNA topoisomerase-1
MELIIVESPAKAKALRGFLGSGYRAVATMGHIRDLPPKQLGVDIDHDFRPTYWYRRGGKKVASRIRGAAVKALKVYLATDPDREGEAIAWHVREALGSAIRDKDTYRITFHEITPEAVRDALSHPGRLDMDLVDAQQARRVLDRLVGYQVSPVLWKVVKGRKGLSAGRVQTVALRLVVERDRAIEAFDPEEYWTLEVELSKLPPHSPHFRARLVAMRGGAESKPDGDSDVDLKSDDDVRPVVEDVTDAEYEVLDVKRKRNQRRPYPPYITSTLQRDAAFRLHWNSSKTMRVAQQLYEGVDLPDEGVVGLITYMRTDATTVAESAQQEARDVILRYWGEDHLPDRPPEYRTKSKVAQEAHEAIRPTASRRTPKAMRAILSSDQAKLYELIWRRFIASQMAPAVFNDTTVDIRCSKRGQRRLYIFRASGRELLFEGFMKVYEVRWSQRSSAALGAANQTLPHLTVDEPLRLHEIYPEQHFTEPPPHFTESSLIKELEKRGIGRPSTYAGIVRTLFSRKYVTREGRSLMATPLGFVVCDFLVEQFPDLFVVPFTAEMEEDLDRIARSERAWVEVLRDFYGPFAKALKAARAMAQDTTITVPKPEVERTGEVCPECGGDVVIRSGKYGKFKGCATYPSCTWTSPLRKKGKARQSDSHTGEACPKCGGNVVIRKGKYGPFRACSNYPQCRWSAPLADKESVSEGEGAGSQ